MIIFSQITHNLFNIIIFFALKDDCDRNNI